MKREELLTLYEYNYWANKRLLGLAAKLTDEQFRATGNFPWGGVRGTLVHTLDTEQIWRMVLQHGIDEPEEL